MQKKFCLKGTKLSKGAEIVMWSPDVAQITKCIIGQRWTPFQDMSSDNMGNPYLSDSLSVYYVPDM